MVSFHLIKPSPVCFGIALANNNQQLTSNQSFDSFIRDAQAYTKSVHYDRFQYGHYEINGLPMQLRLGNPRSPQANKLFVKARSDQHVALLDAFLTRTVQSLPQEKGRLAFNRSLKKYQVIDGATVVLTL